MIKVFAVILSGILAITVLLLLLRPEKTGAGGGAGSGLRVPDFVETWWTSRGDEGRKFLWYVAVIILAYIAARIAPEGKDLIFRGVVALLGVHLIWTFMSSGKINVLSWTIVGGMLIYFVLAWGYPDDVPRIFDASWGLSKKVVHSAANKVESANTDYDNPPSQAGIPAPIVATNAGFTDTVIPDGSSFTFFCPGGTLMTFVDDNTSRTEIDCDKTQRGLVIGDKTTGRHIGFKSKDSGTRHPTLTFGPG